MWAGCLIALGFLCASVYADLNTEHCEVDLSEAAVSRTPTNILDDADTAAKNILESSNGIYSAYLPSADEERALFIALDHYRTTGQNGDFERIRTALTLAYTKLCSFFVRRHCDKGYEFDDLMGNGILGLLDAIDTFDVARGNRFGAHLRWKVWTAVRPYIETHQQFRGVGGNGEDDLQLLNVIGDARDGERTLARENVQGGLRILTPRERKIMELRYGLTGEDPMTLEEIGLRLGFSKETARKDEAKAIEKLEKYFSD